MDRGAPPLVARPPPGRAVLQGVRGVVTISSSYGAGGAVIGPAVADALGLPYFDRAIPVAVAGQLAMAISEAEARDERPPTRSERLISALANMSVPLGPVPVTQPYDSRTAYCRATEDVLAEIAAGPGGVVLGRAGMAVLAEHPNVLRVRLGGPVEARIAQAMAHQGVDDATARTQQRDTDRARDLYAHTFYGVRQDDTRLYQLVLDSTDLSFEVCNSIIVQAAHEVLSRPPAS